MTAAREITSPATTGFAIRSTLLEAPEKATASGGAGTLPKAAAGPETRDVRAPGGTWTEDGRSMLTHRTVAGDALYVRLLPALSIRSRAAATLALEELLAAYTPRRVVLDVPGLPTQAALSMVLRAERSCRDRGAVLAVVAAAEPTRGFLRESLPADGPGVHGAAEDALAAARRAGAAS